MSKSDFCKIFPYEFKLGRSVAQTDRKIKKPWGERSVNECTVVTCDLKSSSFTTIGDVPLSAWITLGSTILSKRQTAPKKVMVPVGGLYSKLCQQQPALVNRKELILLHDNAGLHFSQLTLQKENELSYETLPHSSYFHVLLHPELQILTLRAWISLFLVVEMCRL